MIDLDLFQAHYQILLIIFLKKFIVINAQTVMSVKDDQLIFKCSKCNKNHNEDFNKDLINRFASTYKFCDGDINKFIFLLRKRVYQYEYMDNLERFGEILLPNKEDFYSSLNMEDIKDVDYRHAKKVFKEFKMNNSGEYNNLYVLSET